MKEDSIQEVEQIKSIINIFAKSLKDHYESGTIPPTSPAGNLYRLTKMLQHMEPAVQLIKDTSQMQKMLGSDPFLAIKSGIFGPDSIGARWILFDINKIPRDPSNMELIVLLMRMYMENPPTGDPSVAKKMKSVKYWQFSEELKQKDLGNTAHHVCKMVKQFLRLYTTAAPTGAGTGMGAIPYGAQLNIDFKKLSLYETVVKPILVTLQKAKQNLAKLQTQSSTNLKRSIRTHIERPTMMNVAMDFNDVFIGFLQMHQFIEIGSITGDPMNVIRDLKNKALIYELTQAEKKPKKKFLEFLNTHKGEAFLRHFEEYQELKALMQKIFYCVNLDWAKIYQRHKTEQHSVGARLSAKLIAQEDFCVELYRLLDTNYEVMEFIHRHQITRTIIPEYSQNISLAFAFENWFELRELASKQDV